MICNYFFIFLFFSFYLNRMVYFSFHNFLLRNWKNDNFRNEMWKKKNVGMFCTMNSKRMTFSANNQLKNDKNFVFHKTCG